MIGGGLGLHTENQILTCPSTRTCRGDNRDYTGGGLYGPVCHLLETSDQNSLSSGFLSPRCPASPDLRSAFHRQTMGGSMEIALEILTTGKTRSEGRRDSPDEVKSWVVSENLGPGVTGNDVLGCYGLQPNRLSSCRTMERQSKPVLPAPEDAMQTVVMAVETPADGAP